MDALKTPEIKNSMAEIFINLLSFTLLGVVASAKQKIASAQQL